MTSIAADALTNTEINSGYVRRSIVFCTNKGLCETSELACGDSAVFLALMTNDIEASMMMLNVGVMQSIEDRMCSYSWSWDRISVYDIEYKPEENGRVSFPDFLFDNYGPPKITSFCYEDELSRRGREECQRVLSLDWDERPRLFAVPREEARRSPLWDVVWNRDANDFRTNNIVVKRIIDDMCEKFFEERMVTIVEQL